MSIRSIISEQVLVTLGPKATVVEAGKLMASHNIGSIVIMDNSRIAGIFTERDLATRVVVKNIDPVKTEILDVMTKDVICIDIETDTEEAYKKMKAEGCRHLPVTEQGDIVGIVSIRNLMDLMLQKLRYERDLLKQYVDN